MKKPYGVPKDKSGSNQHPAWNMAKPTGMKIPHPTSQKGKVGPNKS